MKARRTVLVHAAFEADFARQLAWLERAGDIRRVENLQSELLELRDLLRFLPLLGRRLGQDGGVSARGILLPKAPYIAWYLDDPATEAIWLLRLFHVRQDRPTFNLRRWLKRAH